MKVLGYLSSMGRTFRFSDKAASCVLNLFKSVNLVFRKSIKERVTFIEMRCYKSMNQLLTGLGG